MVMENMTREEAIQNLVQLGFLIPMRDLQLFHGRSAFTDPDTNAVWHVNPRFNNSGNSTGNRNVNHVAALNTGEYGVARRFAEARDGRNRRNYPNRVITKSTIQVHRIVPLDDSEDLYFMRTAFYVDALEESKQILFRESIKTLGNVSVTELMPADFKDRLIMKTARGVMQEKGKKNEIHLPLSNEDIDLISRETSRRMPSVNRDEVNDYVRAFCEAFNTKTFLKYLNPAKLMNAVMYDNETSIQYNGRSYNINPQVLFAWCRKNNIIGNRTMVDSATLNDTLVNFLIFDLDKVNTVDYVRESREKMHRNYDAVDRIFDNRIPDKEFQNDILSIDDPQEFVKAASSHLGIQKYLDMSAGVWEGFTVGEHTETALRIFEDGYSHKITPNVAKMLRFLLLIHDIGKGIARKKSACTKDKEDAYTMETCHKVIYPKIGIGKESAQWLIDFLITENLELASKAHLNKLQNKKPEIQAWRDRIVEELALHLNRMPTPDEIRGIMCMGEVMFACDGGAYSTYAITRDHDTGDYYRNGNERFSQTFKKPGDIARRIIELKHENFWNEM